MSDTDRFELGLKRSELGGFVAYHTNDGEVVHEGRGNSLPSVLVDLLNDVLDGEMEYPKPYELIGRDEPYPLVYDAAWECDTDENSCTHDWATYCPIQEEYHCLGCGAVYE